MSDLKLKLSLFRPYHTSCCSCWELFQLELLEAIVGLNLPRVGKPEALFLARGGEMVCPMSRASLWGTY